MAFVGRRPEKADLVACLGKTRWRSEQAARWALASMRREQPGAFGSTLHVYRCRAAGRAHWHWGHSV